MARTGRTVLRGGGAMGDMMRGFDWTSTPLGPVDSWPSPLKTLVGVMLAAKQPMFVAWGAELTMLYNDGYVDLLGSKHPALGAPFLRVWAETRDASPTFDRPGPRRRSGPYGRHLLADRAGGTRTGGAFRLLVYAHPRPGRRSPGLLLSPAPKRPIRSWPSGGRLSVFPWRTISVPTRTRAPSWRSP